MYTFWWMRYLVSPAILFPNNLNPFYGLVSDGLVSFIIFRGVCHSFNMVGHFLRFSEHFTSIGSVAFIRNSVIIIQLHNGLTYFPFEC